MSESFDETNDPVQPYRPKIPIGVDPDNKKIEQLRRTAESEAKQCKTIDKAISIINEYPMAYQWLPEEIKREEEVASAFLQRNQGKLFLMLPESLRGNKEYVLQVLTRYQENSESIMAAITGNVGRTVCLEHLHKLRKPHDAIGAVKNVEAAIQSINADPLGYFKLPPEYQKNKRVIAVAKEQISQCTFKAEGHQTEDEKLMDKRLKEGVHQLLLEQGNNYQELIALMCYIDYRLIPYISNEICDDREKLRYFIAAAGVFQQNFNFLIPSEREESKYGKTISNNTPLLELVFRSYGSECYKKNRPMFADISKITRYEGLSRSNKNTQFLATIFNKNLYRQTKQDMLNNSDYTSVNDDRVVDTLMFEYGPLAALRALQGSDVPRKLLDEYHTYSVSVENDEGGLNGIYEYKKEMYKHRCKQDGDSYYEKDFIESLVMEYGSETEGILKCKNVPQEAMKIYEENMETYMEEDYFRKANINAIVTAQSRGEPLSVLFQYYSIEVLKDLYGVIARTYRN